MKKITLTREVTDVKKWLIFTARVDEYDNHMMNDVVGCKEGYKKMANCYQKQ